MAEDGGPAFPVMEQYDVGGRRLDSPGMTLRDYFAAAALQGWIHGYVEVNARPMPRSEIARGCYDLADAMLAERNKNQEG